MVWLKGIKPQTPTAVVLVGTGLLLIGVVLHIISMSTDYYAVLSASDTKGNLTEDGPQVNYGLWRFCVELKSNGTSCYTFGTVDKNKNTTSLFTRSNLLDTPQWLASSQVLSIVSVIVAGSGVVSAISWIVTDLGCCVNLLLGVATCSSVIGGVLVLASDIVFAAKYTVDFYKDIGVQRNIFNSAQFKGLDDRLDFGWSFGLDIASGILCILSTIPLLMVSICGLDAKQRRSSKNDELTFVSESAGHDRL